MSLTPKAPTLEQWQTLYDDQAALLKDPAAQRTALNALAQALFAGGLLDAGGLADCLEQADAAFAWAEEERLGE